MYILGPKKHPGKRFPQICSFKKPSSSVVSGKPNRDYIILYIILVPMKHPGKRFPKKNTPIRARRAKFVPGGEGSGDVQLHAISF